jgi:hypothetical protein
MQVIPASDNDKRPSATYEYYIIVPIDGHKVTLYLLWAASRDPCDRGICLRGLDHFSTPVATGKVRSRKVIFDF